MTTSPHAEHLRVDALVEPLGVGSEHPDFSWRVYSDATGVVQSGYRIQVADGEVLVWDSGRIDSDLPFGARYAGTALRSATSYSWRVQVWDADGSTGGWSAPAHFETGMLASSDWAAHWVTAPPGVAESAPLYLRGVLDLDRPVVRARAYASALGWYRLFVNGEDLVGSSLVPRFTPFAEIVEYQVFDVTDILRRGANVVAMAVGDGRFRGHQGFFDRREVYGTRLAGFVQLELEFEDGSIATWVSDSGWSAGAGRITSSDPKLGENVDLRIADADWLQAAAPPAGFVAVDLLPEHPRRLVAEEVPRVKSVAEFSPSVWRSPSGRQLVDLGQNVAGVLRIRLAGERGAKVRMTFGEALTPDGEFDPDWIIQNPKKPWFQRDEVILDGTDQWWQPWFTIHGFRYVEVDGLDHDLAPDDVVGVALSSDLADAGSFESSDVRLNRLWRNVYWSTRSNFTDTPTDCPTRERSGWTGDIQVFAPTATGMVDSQAFLRRYLRNVAIEQTPTGNVSPWVPSERSGEVGVVPRLISAFLGNSVGWGDVAVLTPWALYRYYGDREVLVRQYDSMRRWVDRLARQARRPGPQRWFSRRVGRLERFVLDSGFHWGEWLRPGEQFPADFLDGTLHGASLATAYFEHSARVLAQTADVIGQTADAAHYRDLADSVRRAWRAAFVSARGSRIGRDLQDDYVRALAFGLLDGDDGDNSDERANAVARLVELVEQNGFHLATGFLSTPMLLAALSDNGRADVAFRLLLQDSVPSWLYEVDHQATTVWETWAGHDESGRARESQNHYALGSVAGWMRENLIGITPVDPGYRRIRIAPVIGGGLDWAAGSVETPFGTVSARWETTGSGGRMHVTVPVGTEAELALPGGVEKFVGSGAWTLDWAAEVPGPAAHSA